MTNDANDGVRTGGCQCGFLRYELRAPSVKVYICHCTECRKQSASAFGISVIANSSSFALTRGTPNRWSRRTDSGRSMSCYFCPICGSRVWHGDAAQQARISIKGGSLDEPVDVAAAVHIWTTRKLQGIAIPELAEQHAREPSGGGAAARAGRAITRRRSPCPPAS